jgi:AraC-like DNA-binding protein
VKISYEKIPASTEASFTCIEANQPDFNCPHHFHPEIEITQILASEGERLVGDRFDTYAPGDLAMFGSNLPHRYRNWESSRSHSRVVQFLPDAFGVEFFNLPEFRQVRKLFQDAARGLHFSDQTRKQANSAINRLFKPSEGPQRLTHLIDLLHILSQDHARQAMASNDYMAAEKAEQSERLQRILNYIDAHWQEKLSLSEVAKVAHLHPQSLSRYFHKHLRRTFQQYLIELRLSRASRELLETKHAITDIAYNCGFNNLANFNRSFRAQYKMPPREYRKK